MFRATFNLTDLETASNLPALERILKSKGINPVERFHIMRYGDKAVVLEQDVEFRVEHRPHAPGATNEGVFGGGTDGSRSLGVRLSGDQGVGTLARTPTIASPGVEDAEPRHKED